MKHAAQKLVHYVGSELFFRLTLALFVVSAAWIAFSARYPMAFDEGYHLGIIRIYSFQFSPFFAKQPPGPAMFGALTRDPSYLYHYLMSFPYRWVGYVSSSFMLHVLTLRFIDIALFAIGLVLIRKVLLKTKASPALVNVVLLFFTLTPVLPLLAGQINYDDLIVPLTAGALLLTINFVQALKAKQTFKVGALVGLLAVSLLASLVKFTFLPVLTAIVAYVLFEMWRFSREHRHKLWHKIQDGWRPLPILKKTTLTVLLVVSVGLFINTYGVNIVQYHNPIPQCGQVLGVQRCATYPPWARNYADARYNTGVDANPLRFTASWFYGMFYRLFFTINGPGDPASNDNHLAPVVAIIAAILAVSGFLLFAYYGRRLLKRDAVLSFLLFTMLVYCAALWGRNYHDFLHLGKMVAINGRYLIPVMFPFYLAVALGYWELLSQRLLAKSVLLVVVLLLFLEGGGITSYVYYSNANWYWPHDQLIRQANSRLHKLISPFFIARK